MNRKKLVARLARKVKQLRRIETALDAIMQKLADEDPRGGECEVGDACDSIEDAITSLCYFRGVKRASRS